MLWHLATTICSRRPPPSWMTCGAASNVSATSTSRTRGRARDHHNGHRSHRRDPEEEARTRSKDKGAMAEFDSWCRSRPREEAGPRRHQCLGRGTPFNAVIAGWRQRNQRQKCGKKLLADTTPLLQRCGEGDSIRPGSRGYLWWRHVAVANATTVCDEATRVSRTEERSQP